MREGAPSDVDVLVLDVVVPREAKRFDPHAIMPSPCEFNAGHQHVVDGVNLPVQSVGSAFKLDAVTQVSVVWVGWGGVDVVKLDISEHKVLHSGRVGNDLDAKSHVLARPPIVGFAQKRGQFLHLTIVIKMGCLVGENHVLDNNVAVVVNQKGRLVSVPVENGPGLGIVSIGSNDDGGSFIARPLEVQHAMPNSAPLKQDAVAWHRTFAHSARPRTARHSLETIPRARRRLWATRGTCSVRDKRRRIPAWLPKRRQSLKSMARQVELGLEADSCF